MSDLLKKLAAKFSPQDMAESAAKEKADKGKGGDDGEKSEGGLKGWMAKRKKSRGDKEEKGEKTKDNPAAVETNEKKASLLERLSAKKDLAK